MQSTQQNDLDPNKDDLPLRANTNHMLVRHYVLDLTVDIQRKVIGGSIVLFLEPGKGAAGLKISEVLQAPDVVGVEKEASCSASATHVPGDAAQERDVCRWSWDDESEDFTLILDCCDLLVSKVEEVDVSNVPELRKLLEGGESDVISSQQLSFILIQKLISIPSHQWRQQQDLYLQCSSAPSVHIQGLLFHMDQWSLQVRKKGVRTPCDFPRILRICYETKSTGGSVRWTKDQDNRCCVYTMGSPINNRALFPCQEPPVAMSTWRARIKAPCEYTVLLSGENQACPMPEETGFFQWDYFVTMPMPASTFTIAVGMWREAREKNQSSPSRLTSSVKEEDEQSFCSHVDYPCRFVNNTSRMQVILPHRVFAPFCHLQKVEASVLPLLPLCLAAAHSVLGVHPFSRLDVLIVPPGFSSLGMASPHIIFLSQSVLVGERGLCGARMCHEIAHSWFGLAIGARDWTEEWISEGFATYLEDVFWAKVQQLDRSEEEEQRQLKAFLRWRRLKDELVNSEEELLVLRPNKDNTGEVSDSGASMVKHALNPGKPFMQVHYLKGYFFLKFLASKVGEEEFLCFFRVFVRKFHGQLILSQVLHFFFSNFYFEYNVLKKFCGKRNRNLNVSNLASCSVLYRCRCGCFGITEFPIFPVLQLSPEQLVLLLEFLLEEEVLSVSCLSLLQTTYSLRNQDAEVKHRWCELVVKHKYTAAYRDVENFLIHDQAMGVYLYGELMLQEDGRQQALARRCLSAIKDDMDQSARSVVEEMIL
uniref:Aminopeptidase O (putative) n=1 Tax=Astyanax mexicanus TaxID=7994 RepID=W5KJ54_ASTMX